MIVTVIAVLLVGPALALLYRMDFTDRPGPTTTRISARTSSVRMTREAWRYRTLPGQRSTSRKARTVMGDTDQPGTGAGYDRPGEEWMVGFVVFAGILLIMMGALPGHHGVTSRLRRRLLRRQAGRPGGERRLHAWGWVHLSSAWSPCRRLRRAAGPTWARASGDSSSRCVSAVVNFAFPPRLPIWATIPDHHRVLIIYALAAHGRELRRSTPASSNDSDGGVNRLAARVVTTLSVDERRARGKQARSRRRCRPHGMGAGGRPPRSGRVLEAQNATRDADLVTGRHGRMMVSPFPSTGARRRSWPTT